MDASTAQIDATIDRAHQVPLRNMIPERELVQQRWRGVLSRPRHGQSSRAWRVETWPPGSVTRTTWSRALVNKMITDVTKMVKDHAWSYERLKW